ncbi:MAG: AbrB/MazE/SpoVT family DNA-binding domain-containing protein [bacterium]
MKSTGIVRKIDDLGRLVIPKELRETMNIAKKDPMEVFVEEDKIILSKYEPACIFCGEAGDIIEFKNKNVCPACIEKINQ